MKIWHYWLQLYISQTEQKLYDMICHLKLIDQYTD